MLRSVCLAAVLSLVLAGDAIACSCMAGPADPRRDLQQASAVFAGRVERVTRVGDARRAHFSVERTWKEGAPGRATVGTGYDSASCGFDFVPGRSYLVYAYRQDDPASREGALWTSLCSRTVLLSGAGADLAQLGPGRVSESGEMAVTPGPGWLTGGLLFAAGLLTGLVLAGLRRRRWKLYRSPS